MVEDDLYALAVLRYLDRNPVRAGLVQDPVTYPWSSCAAYALGRPNRLITFHPSYLARSPDPKVRQRQQRTLLCRVQIPGWPHAILAGARNALWGVPRS